MADKYYEVRITVEVEGCKPVVYSDPGVAHNQLIRYGIVVPVGPNGEIEHIVWQRDATEGFVARVQGKKP